MKGIIIAVTVGIAIISAPFGKDEPKGHWESADSFVYYTEERAVFEGVENGVGYFWLTETGDTFGAYLADTVLEEGDVVTLTFENRESKAEYLEAEEYGIESVTRDNGMIVAIND